MNTTRALIVVLAVLMGALNWCLWSLAPTVAALCLTGIIVGASLGFLQPPKLVQLGGIGIHLVVSSLIIFEPLHFAVVGWFVAVGYSSGKRW